MLNLNKGRARARQTVRLLALPVLLATWSAYAIAQAGPSPNMAGGANKLDSELAEAHLRVDRLAIQARHSDAKGIAQLAHAIFERVGIPLDVADGLHYSQRVAQAETDYRNGSLLPLHDQDLVMAHNNFAHALSLPGWASTNLEEVRMLRMRFVALYPQLLGSHAPAGKGGKLQILSNDISPAEAVFLSTTLIYQKLFNEEFQMTQTERASNSPLSDLDHRQRTNDLYRILHGNTDNVDVVDIVRAADGVFNDLHIGGTLRPEFAILPSETPVEGGSK